MNQRPVLRFAFDIGTNSIGWSVLKGAKSISGASRQGGATALQDVMAIGSRVFSDGRNPKDGSSLAMMRRAPRAARRRRDRFLQRQRHVLALLTRFGLMPADENARRALEKLDPYELRARGLDVRLEPFELGRALFHLNQRRGYKSNRRTDSQDKDRGVIREAAERLQAALRTEGCRTLGELLNSRKAQGHGTRFRFQVQGNKSLIDLYPTRELVEAEFDALWSAQGVHAPDVLTEKARAAIRDAIFFQRPLKPVRPGRCTLATGEERLPAALPSVQARIIYQTVNELRFGEGLSPSTPLSREQRDVIASALLRGSSLSFDRIRRDLKLPSAMRFSLEETRDEITGCPIAKRLADKKGTRFGTAWHALPFSRKDEIVRRLLEEEDEDMLVAWLATACGLSSGAAQAVASTPLEDGYGRLGATANAAVLEELTDDVITYSEACRRAGYNHALLSESELLSRLPYYGRALERHVAFGSGDESDPEEKRYGRIANPTVHIGLNQLRRVTNQLIATYGRPDEIVVELARELKQTAKEKDREARKNRDNEAANKRRAGLLAENGLPDTPPNRMLLRLWEEQRDGLQSFCPYSGAQISIGQLFSGEVEIDHVLPFSRTLDDSIGNKVVCFREANRRKRHRTPFEAFGGEAIWRAIAANAERLPPNKRWRFAPDAMERFETHERDFLDRQLNETKHIARLAREYLSLVAPDVWVVTGSLTSLLRGKWGLNSVLGKDNRKNRHDHRHHAIDAAVIGCASRALLNELSRRAGQAEVEDHPRIVADVPEPFTGFRERVRDLAREVIVSHKPEHGKGGALHEDTAYGLVPDGHPDQLVGNLVYRKPLASLTAKEIDRVRDIVLRQQLQAVRDEEGADPKTLGARLQAFAEAKAQAEQARSGLSRNPIRHIRLLKPDASARAIPDRRTGIPYKAVVPGENWCIDIVALRDGTWRGYAATLFEVSQPDWRPLWERDKVGGKLVMRLRKGDLVETDAKDGSGRAISRVVQLNPTGNRVLLASHTDSGSLQKRNDDPEDAFRWDIASYSRLQERNARLVRVDEIGRVLV